MVIGLPKFNFISFGIQNPRKLAVVKHLGFANNGDALGHEFNQQPVQIVYPKILHERLFTRIEILRVGGKRRPLRTAVIALLVFPPKSRAVDICFQAKVFAIPCHQFLWVLRFKEYPANSRHADVGQIGLRFPEIFFLNLVCNNLRKLFMALKSPAGNVRCEDDIWRIEQVLECFGFFSFVE